MKILLSLTLGALLFAGVTATGHAQEVMPNGAADPGHPRVNQVDSRERRQDARIAQGDRSGQLTNGETARIDRRENNIQNSNALDQAGHNGHLTKAEQRRLNRRQNRLSRTIRRDKHNRRAQG